jgi:hypothetical protein
MAYKPNLANLASQRQVASLDIEYAMSFHGLGNRDAALVALHQYRYERVDMADHLRLESRRWLQVGGHERLDGLPWPTDEALPA